MKDLIFRLRQIADELEEEVPFHPFYGLRRNPRWDELADEHLRENACCAACGGKKKLQVHHIKPFHLFPELEMEPSNLITLCDANYKHCHFIVGHLCSWHSWNPDVVDDASWLMYRIKNRP